MVNFVTSKKRFFIVFSLVTLLVISLAAVKAAAAQTTSKWKEPINLSAKSQHAWFPDVAVDGEGTLHVVYLGSDFLSEKDSPLSGKYDKVYYQPISADGVPKEAGPFNIAVSPYGVVPRSSIAVDNKRGLLHMLFRSKGSLYYQYAAINQATQPQAWSTPRNIDDFGTSYYSDIVVDQNGTVHIVWTQVKGDVLDSLHQVIIYRQSSDLGVSWSFPKQVVEPKFGATRVALKLDPKGGLHLSYDDGYDNQTARFFATYGAYSHSIDNGKTWSNPVLFGSEQEPVAQTVVTPFGENGVMLVWRVLQKQEVYFTISNDRGETWATPQPLPEMYARRLTAQHFFDRYYLATDPKGRVYFAGVGLTDPKRKGVVENESDLALYYSVWENGTWSTPEIVAQLPGFAEYPRIGIGPDSIEIVWFVRNKPVDEDTKSVWYTSRPYDTGVKLQPVGAYVPPTPTAVAPPTAKASPTEIPIKPPLESAPQQSWMEEGYKVTLVSLVPVIIGGLIIAGVVFWQLRRTRKV